MSTSRQNQPKWTHRKDIEKIDVEEESSEVKSLEDSLYLNPPKYMKEAYRLHRDDFHESFEKMSNPNEEDSKIDQIERCNLNASQMKKEVVRMQGTLGMSQGKMLVGENLWNTRFMEEFDSEDEDFEVDWDHIKESSSPKVEESDSKEIKESFSHPECPSSQYGISSNEDCVLGQNLYSQPMFQGRVNKILQHLRDKTSVIRPQSKIIDEVKSPDIQESQPVYNFMKPQESFYENVSVPSACSYDVEADYGSNDANPPNDDLDSISNDECLMNHSIASSSKSTTNDDSFVSEEEMLQRAEEILMNEFCHLEDKEKVEEIALRIQHEKLMQELLNHINSSTCEKLTMSSMLERNTLHESPNRICIKGNDSSEKEFETMYPLDNSNADSCASILDSGASLQVHNENEEVIKQTPKLTPEGTCKETELFHIPAVILFAIVLLMVGIFCSLIPSFISPGNQKLEL